MELVLETIRADADAFLRFAPRLFYGVVLLAVFVVIAGIAGRLMVKLIRRTERFRANERFLRRVVSWSIGSVGVLLALSVMGFTGIARSMLATGGVAAIVLGFAFREIGENFLAGFFLTFSRPFEIGDLVKTGELTGIVRGIEIRSVHIRAEEACDVFVPSAQIFREPLYNYTRDGLRRPNFTVGVAYHDDPEKITGLLREAAVSVPDVLADPQAFVIIKEFAAAYIEYGVYFWIDQKNSTLGYVGATNAVKASCWRALRDAGMTFSTDVRAGLEVFAMPELSIALEESA